MAGIPREILVGSMGCAAPFRAMPPLEGRQAASKDCAVPHGSEISFRRATSLLPRDNP
jgi:hypothetical protein